MNSALGALWREARIAYLRWAMREMHPAHPDLPEVLQRLAELQCLRVRAQQPPRHRLMEDRK